MGLSRYDNWIEGNMVVIVTSVFPSGAVNAIRVPNDMFYYYVSELRAREMIMYENYLKTINKE